MSRLLLNCDIGESFGNWTLGLDAEVMPFIDCANVACGFHAGDPSIMRKTVSLAFQHGVQVGAHPAYQDLAGFGRRSIAYTPQEIQDLLHYQIGALEGICRAQGGRVSYVKPHGAMYNDMMAKPEQLRAVIKAVAAYGELPLMLMATRDNSAAQALGDEYGVTLWFEAFADRAYDSAGHLVSRLLPGAVHRDPDQIVEQALIISRGEPLTASDGSALYLQANTLCVHGDNVSSVAAVQRIREALTLR
ncbi:5-oxoprolinase subunit PxpA [Pseudomonas sp. CCM 7893]|uniref:5-oxoprolinase subunit PxpA n=1 Tax=Pseudomonas spelaei TaxID=1055469 RepID=A0A6I3WB23_9PSED|nr:5-oxoprolinase subunit PxpA [Pseudomonas spelaei]